MVPDMNRETIETALASSEDEATRARAVGYMLAAWSRGADGPDDLEVSLGRAEDDARIVEHAARDAGVTVSAGTTDRTVRLHRTRNGVVPEEALPRDVDALVAGALARHWSGQPSDRWTDAALEALDRSTRKPPGAPRSLDERGAREWLTRVATYERALRALEALTTEPGPP